MFFYFLAANEVWKVGKKVRALAKVAGARWEGKGQVLKEHDDREQKCRLSHLGSLLYKDEEALDDFLTRLLTILTTTQGHDFLCQRPVTFNA